MKSSVSYLILSKNEEKSEIKFQLFHNSKDHNAEGSRQKLNFSLCSLLDCIMLAYGDSGYRLGAPFLLLCGDSTRESSYQLHGSLTENIIFY